MKKITYKDLATLRSYKKNHLLERIGCNHYITDETTYSVRVITKVKWPVYVALFIPACVLQAVSLVWDGGLKQFSIEPRTIRNDVVWKDSEGYKKFAKNT